MVASASPSVETKKLNKTSPLVKPTKLTKLKMESATSTFGELFPLSRDAPSVVPTSNIDAQTLLDEWLANDLQQTGFLSEGDACSASSSPSLSMAGDKFPSSPPLTDVDGSPMMEFDVTGDGSLLGSPLFEEDVASTLSSPIFSAAPSPMITPASVLERSPVLEDMMNLFPELGVVSGGFTIPTTPMSASATLPAGFTIPWTSDRLPAHMSPAQALVDTPPMTPVSATASATPSPRTTAKTKATKRPAETKSAAMDDITVKRQKVHKYNQPFIHSVLAVHDVNLFSIHLTRIPTLPDAPA